MAYSTVNNPKKLEEGKIQFITYIGTKNTTSGNPRRAYIVSEIDLTADRKYPYIVDVLDEGYDGNNAFKVPYPHLEAPGYMFNVSPSEYKNYLKIGDAKRQGRIDDEKARQEEETRKKIAEIKARNKEADNE